MSSGFQLSAASRGLNDLYITWEYAIDLPMSFLPVNSQYDCITLLLQAGLQAHSWSYLIYLLQYNLPKYQA